MIRACILAVLILGALLIAFNACAAGYESKQAGLLDGYALVPRL